MSTPDYTKLVQGQRRYFKAGKTRPVSWRVEQLKAIKVMIEARRGAIREALWHDLRRNETDADLMDIDINIHEAEFALAHLHDWIKPRRGTFTDSLAEVPFGSSDAVAAATTYRAIAITTTALNLRLIASRIARTALNTEAQPLMPHAAARVAATRLNIRQIRHGSREFISRNSALGVPSSERARMAPVSDIART